MRNHKVPAIVFSILYLVIGLLDLIYGADPSSRFFYFDDLFLRFIGMILIVSSIGLFLKKEIARKGIILGLSLSVIEPFIGIPQGMDIVEIIVGVIILLIICVPGLLYFIYPESKLWSKIFRENNKKKITTVTEEAGTIEEKVKIELSMQSSIKNAASWFYWIAGFSIINTLIMFFDGGINFIVGLGIAQLVDGYAYAFSEYFGMTAIVVGFMINILIAGVFVYFGIMAKKHKKWSFIVGMSLYGFDAIIFIIFRDYLGFAFHIFALISIFRGFRDLAKATDTNTTENNEPNIDLYINS